MLIKTSELIGTALDWAAAKCEGWTNTRCGETCDCLQHRNPRGECDLIPTYSTDWSQGGPIMEREKIGCWCDDRTGVWGANKQGIPYQQFGPTPLVAAMRCYVASKLGEEVEVPDDLT